MRNLNAKRLLYILALVAAHAAAISSGVFLRQQTAHAQEGGDTVRWGRRMTVDGLPACDCTATKVWECVCQTNTNE